VIIGLEFEVKGNAKKPLFFMAYGNFYRTLSALMSFNLAYNFFRTVDSR